MPYFRADKVPNIFQKYHGIFPGSDSEKQYKQAHLKLLSTPMLLQNYNLHGISGGIKGLNLQQFLG